MNFKYKLPAGYTIREIKTADFGSYWREHARKIFDDDSMMYDPDLIESAQEKKLQGKLRDRFQLPERIRINLGMFYKNKFVGWSWGYQETPVVFYMTNSAILPKHRRKGLYNCLMKEMLKRTSELGFAKIYSRHMMTNNEILIAKLKQGFKITHFESSEAFGTLVHLTYFPSKIKNDILDFRVGHKRPNKRIKKLFKL